MAKISRRAVASSSSSSSSTSSSSTAAGATSSISTPNANNIASVGKTARISALENSANSGGAVLPDPLRNGNAASQITTHNNAGATAGPNEHSPYTAHPTLFDGDLNASASPASTPTYLQNRTAQLLAAERERVRAEFFATYDVMTGVRIAATLGGFFGLMVFLIVWKSRSSSNETLKVLKDPKMAAVAAVCMQEEDERKIQEAMVATGMSIYPDEYDAIVYRRQRMLSLGNVSAPPMLNRGFRFSSVGGGGYSSLLEPPRRFSYSAASGFGSLAGTRRKSGSESSRILSNYPMGSSFGTDDYFIETEDEFENGDYQQGGQRLEELRGLHKRTDSTKSKPGFLEVPLTGQDSRRSSAMTCCSTESSYLERRCSAFTLGLGHLPPSLQRKLSTASRTSSTDNWDYYYPDIQVIQPTPKPSPCPSERSIYEQLKTRASKPTTTHTATVSVTAQQSTPLTTTTKTTTSKTAKANQQTAANGGAAGPAPHTFVRKHSIAYYDPESAQAGRKQQIHSISADTVDVYPYNQATLPESSGDGQIKPIQSAPPVGVHHGFHFTDSPTEELRLNVRRKIALVEFQRIPYAEQMMTPPPIGGSAYENNNTYPYNHSAAAAAANSSSISIDSTPVSIDKLNGSGSLGTISAKALFNAEKRAPLASLSSFKISSLEYQDSEMRSLDEDSVFLDSVADTDEDMQQMSSDSEEVSLGGERDPTFTRTDTILVAPLPPPSQEATSTGRPSSQQPLRYPIEKRFSLGASTTPTTTATPTPTPTTTSGPTASRARRPLLQRHRTISASSSDRISLIGQQMKEFHSGGSSHQQQASPANQTMPLETHFGTVICTNSPPTHPRRAHLLQQYSDPQSLPTTTEDDTCSTLNTEVCAGLEEGASGGGASGSGIGGGSNTHTQHSSLNTVVSFGRSSPLADISHASCSTAPGAAAASSPDTHSPTQPMKQQLPRSRLADDPCASSISDSVISTQRQPIICMPSSLKNLILRGSTAGAAAIATTSASSAVATVSRSATNLSLFDDRPDDADVLGGAHHSPCPSVMLELPLIKLPTEESSESGGSASEDDDIERSRSRSKSDESRDPSLPGSSRKWSKETLF